MKRKISLLFDLDGTLWDTSITTFEAAKTILHDDIISMETIKKSMGKTKDENAKLYFPNLNKEEAFVLLDEISKENRRLIENGEAYIYPNVENTLNTLSKDYDLFIISNSSSNEYVNLISRYIKVPFKEKLAAGSINMDKENAIKHIIKKYNIERAIYIGDTIIDKLSAENNNIPFVYASYGFGSVIDNGYIINSIDDIIELISSFIK